MWDDPAGTERLLGPRAETEMLLALRHGARVWEPLGGILQNAAPDQLRLTDDEAFGLLGDATDALSGAGIVVHWPRDLAKALTAQAVVGGPAAPGSTVSGLLDADTLLDFQWRVLLGDEELTDAGRTWHGLCRPVRSELVRPPELYGGGDDRVDALVQQGLQHGEGIASMRRVAHVRGLFQGATRLCPLRMVLSNGCTKRECAGGQPGFPAAPDEVAPRSGQVIGSRLVRPDSGSAVSPCHRGGARLHGR